MIDDTRFSFGVRSHDKTNRQIDFFKMELRSEMKSKLVRQVRMRRCLFLCYTETSFVTNKSDGLTVQYELIYILVHFG